MLDLIVGDPHVRPEDLPDSEALLEAVQSLSEKADRVIFLGDLHHTHAVVYTDVMAFWLKHLGMIRKPIVMLLGNHDRPADRGSKSHALMAYKRIPNVTVVDAPYFDGETLFLPYYFEPSEFVAAALEYPTAKRLVCHQTLQGATYENGFYAKDGVDAQLVPQPLIISGHIHTAQDFGKVCYPGSPRWLNVNDANVNKSLWLLDSSATSTSGHIAIPTDKFCSRLVHFSDTPDAPLDFQPIGDHRYVVDLVGPQEWIESRKSVYLGRARVRTFRTDNLAAKVKESDGISVALHKYVEGFRAPNLTPTPVLMGMVDDRYTA